MKKIISLNNGLTKVGYLMASLWLSACGLQLTEQAPESRARLQLASSNFIGVTGEDSISFSDDDKSLEYKWAFKIDGYTIPPIGYGSADQSIQNELHSIPTGGIVTITGPHSDPVIEYEGPGSNIQIDFCLDVRDSRNFESQRTSCGVAFLAPVQPQICTDSAQYTIGGKVSGLPIGETVKVTNVSTGEVLTIAGNGDFIFPKVASTGDQYQASIVETSVGTQCQIQNEVGQVTDQNVTQIRVICTDERFQVKGTFVTRYCGNYNLILKVNGINRGIYSTDQHLADATIENSGIQKTFPANFTNTLVAGDYVEIVPMSEPQNVCTSVNAEGIYGQDAFLNDFLIQCSCPGP